MEINPWLEMYRPGFPVRKTFPKRTEQKMKFLDDPRSGISIPINRVRNNGK